MWNLILLFVLVFVAGCEEQDSDFKARKRAESLLILQSLQSDREKLFSVIEYDGRKRIDYAYCGRPSEIFSTDLVIKGTEEYLLLTCLPINNYNKITGEKSRYFKYSKVYSNGNVVFCGWRDITSYPEKYAGSKINPNKIIKTGISGECPNFNIENQNQI
jgi:hypothetical protein